MALLTLLASMSLIVPGLGGLQTPQSNVTPHRIVLTATQDLSTSAVVSWRTEAPTQGAGGELAEASPDPRFTASAKPYPAESQEFVLPRGSKVYYNTVRFNGLTPGRKYTYRVGSPQGWSEWIQFQTARADTAPFAFTYFGDAQNDIKSMWSRVVRQAFKNVPESAFFLHAGDLINEDMSDHEWAEWFYAGGWIHNQTPVVAIPGNHEYQTVNGKKVISPFWKPQFANPENGLRGLEGSCYYIDYQGARIIALNSNERIKEQAAWLDRTLKSNPHKWAIVSFHHPVHSTALGRDNKVVRDAWAPVLEKHNVPLVLQGHDHTYGRKNLSVGTSGKAKASGTVYVVSVSGPKMYRLGKETGVTMPRRAEFSQLYQIVRVSQQKIRFEAYLSTGDLYDAFEISKNPDGTNRVVAKRVKSPERIEKTPAKERRGN